MQNVAYAHNMVSKYSKSVTGGGTKMKVREYAGGNYVDEARIMTWDSALRPGKNPKKTEKESKSMSDPFNSRVTIAKKTVLAKISLILLLMVLLLNLTGCHTFVVWAAEKDDVDSVKRLLSLGFDAKSFDIITQTTALHIAASRGSGDIIDVLLEHGADPYKLDNSGTPMTNAISCGHTDIVERFLSCQYPTVIEPEYLIIASKQGYSDIVKLFLVFNANVNAEYGGTTPLCAAAGGVISAYEEMGSCSQDPFIVTTVIPGPFATNTPFKGSYDTQIYEVENFPNHCLPENEHFEIVKLLLDHGANVNGKDSQMRTPLFYVGDHYKYTLEGYIRSGQEIAKLLLDYGAEVNSVDNFKRTPLHFAVAYQSIIKNGYSKAGYEITQMLIENEADVNAKDENHQTPLHWATSNWQINQIEQFLCKDKTVIIRNFGKEIIIPKEQKSICFEYLRDSGLIDPYQKNVVELLIDSGADINAQDRDGNTPLHKAAYSGLTDLVKIIMSKGGILNKQNKDGKTASDLAGYMGHSDIVNLLNEYVSREGSVKNHWDG
jgi:ankyrin repeat protein